METYDLLMLGILVAAVLFGAVKGLAWQIASAAALIGSYLVAMAFYPTVAEHINADPPWNQYLAMFVLYLGTSFVVWIAFAFVRRMIEKVEMKDFDRQAGAVVGAINGVVVCLLVTFFAITLPFLSDDQKSSICKSQSGKLMATAVDQVKLGLPEDVDQVVRPYLEKFDKNLQDPAGGQDGEEILPALESGVNELFPDGSFQLPGTGGESSATKPWQSPDWRRFAEELESGINIPR